MDIGFKRKFKNDSTLIPYCVTCKIEILITIFSNNIIRYLCPKCKEKRYIRQGENGIVQVKDYCP